MNYPILSYINHYRQFHSLVYEETAETLGLNQLEIDILLFLKNNPECNTARDIVNLRGFAKSNVSTAIDGLQKKGYLSVYTDPESRRVRRLALDSQKDVILSQLVQIQKDSFACLLSGISEDEFRQAQHFMAQLDSNMQKVLKNRRKAGEHNGI